MAYAGKGLSNPEVMLCFSLLCFLVLYMWNKELASSPPITGFCWNGDLVWKAEPAVTLNV